MEEGKKKESGKEVYIKVRCKCGEFKDLPMRPSSIWETHVTLYFEQTETRDDECVSTHQQQFKCDKCGTQIIIGAEGESPLRPIKFLSLSYLSP
jgi:hypothetical protein